MNLQLSAYWSLDIGCWAVAFAGYGSVIFSYWVGAFGCWSWIFGILIWCFWDIELGLLDWYGSGVFSYWAGTFGYWSWTFWILIWCFWDIELGLLDWYGSCVFSYWVGTFGYWSEFLLGIDLGLLGYRSGSFGILSWGCLIYMDLESFGYWGGFFGYWFRFFGSWSEAFVILSLVFWLVWIWSFLVIEVIELGLFGNVCFVFDIELGLSDWYGSGCLFRLLSWGCWILRWVF